MEFRNLTPLHAMAFNAVDVPGNEFHVVVLKAAYRLEKTRSVSLDGDTHRFVLLEGDEAAPLAMADEYEGREGASSVKFESDLSPFKPKCDVIVHATSHAPHGTPELSWPARVRVVDRGSVVIDKGLRIFGPRNFRKTWRGWRLSEPERSTELPVRWEYTYGGTSLVAPSAAASDGTASGLNEVCFTNPLGCGWLEKRFLDLATNDGVKASADVLEAPVERSKISELRAPQIERWGHPVTTFDLVSHATPGLDATQMAQVAASYASTPAGLGAIGRAWTPRLQRAGTYDNVWLKDRWPYLPRDFDFAYWNAAPDDQQIAWPDADLRFELVNLARVEETQSGFLRARLPGHRAVAALYFGRDRAARDAT
jgi:hypothetical protein